MSSLSLLCVHCLYLFETELPHYSPLSDKEHLTHFGTDRFKREMERNRSWKLKKSGELEASGIEASDSPDELETGLEVRPQMDKSGRFWRTL